MADKDVKYERDENFETLYANSIQFEPSVWDLKLICGILDQQISEVTNHTAICVPWSHAKLAAYFLIGQIVAHQAEEGAIALPTRVIPPRPDPSSPELNQAAKPVVEYLAWIHDQFFGSNPYVPPNVQVAQEQLKAEQEKK